MSPLLLINLIFGDCAFFFPVGKQISYYPAPELEIPSHQQCGATLGLCTHRTIPGRPQCVCGVIGRGEENVYFLQAVSSQGEREEKGLGYPGAVPALRRVG